MTKRLLNLCESNPCWTLPALLALPPLSFDDIPSLPHPRPLHVLRCCEFSTSNLISSGNENVKKAVLSPRHVVESEEKPKTALLIALANESFSF
ncbi:hypothetical protein CEXT_22711 [Caerostris extrusa]|uniref:Uncharacterized protein n=1 Tax=Caerostris extrusa TaxID=172846 RepID=A0AAV4VBH6_CAEEX|nr:hypothetical protein CEXT_22711 [Caerostris extrusa]